MKKKELIKYLNKTSLPTEVKEGIISRSTMLSATLRTISEEDLVQEGLSLVYGILKIKPSATIPYIMKAINNHYATIQSQEVVRKSIPLTPIDSDYASKELDKISYRVYQKGKKKPEDISPDVDEVLPSDNGIMAAVQILKDRGYSFKEIAEYLGKDIKSLREALRRHGRKHKESDM